MFKRALVGIFILGAVFFLMAGKRQTPAPEGGTNLPSKMIFDNSEAEPKFSKFAGYDQDKGHVEFDHAAHVGYQSLNCVICHHTNATGLKTADGKASEFVMRCTNCHTDQPEAPSPFEGTHETAKFKGKPAVEVKFAFMGRETSSHPARFAGCISCHKEMGKQFPKAARVTVCNSCHNL